jgi:mannose/fructose-specific phosphotransferase system component IIA
MSEVKGIVIAHGDMAVGIVDAVRQITGLEDGALLPLTNRGCSPDTLIDNVRRLLVEGESTILFTDLQGGSCAVAARRLTQQLPGTAVISGANLPLLLEFALNRSLPIDDLVPRLVERGRQAIVSALPGLQPMDAAKK